MLEIILFVLGVVGFTHIMVDGKIMLPLREWLVNPSFDCWAALRYVYKEIILHPVKWTTGVLSSMIGCYQCCGFWCGLVCGFAMFGGFWHTLMAGFAGSFLANFVAIYMNYLEAQTIVNLPPDKEDQ
jgi:hypothetical protein